MDFVWPYVECFSSWYITGLFNELEYSIKSVRKNYQGDVRCFVVGDDPGLDVIHIKAPPLVTSHSSNQPRHMDQMNKFDAILSSQINEEFVLIYDDVFLLKPTTEEEIKTTYGRAEVDNPEEYIMKRDGSRIYKKLWTSTYDYILIYRFSRGLKTYDWETHIPRYLEKEKLSFIMDKLKLRKVPRISTSLYDAYFSEETKIVTPEVQSDLWTHTPGMDFDLEFSKHYMNIGDNVIVPELIDHFKDMFG